MDANTTTTCARRLRTGPCSMDSGHRGRCSTVTFHCDGCGSTRRGRPVVEGYNRWDGLPEVAFCFMCVRELA